MPANIRHRRVEPFPTRGVPGGWRDWWDDPNDSAELRAQAEAAEDRLIAQALWIGLALRQEFEQESSAAGSGALGPS